MEGEARRSSMNMNAHLSNVHLSNAHLSYMSQNSIRQVDTRLSNATIVPPLALIPPKQPSLDSN